MLPFTSIPLIPLPNSHPQLTPYLTSPNTLSDFLPFISLAIANLRKFYSADDLGITLAGLIRLAQTPSLPVFTLSPLGHPLSPRSLPHPLSVSTPTLLSDLWPAWPHCLISFRFPSDTILSFPIPTATFQIGAYQK